MPNWVPIAESGLPFSFTSMTATLVGSTVSADAVNDVQWQIEFTPAPDPLPQVRITVQSYQAGSEFGDVSGAKFMLDDGGPSVEYPNTEPAGNPQTAFVPGQITGPALSIEFQGANGGEFTATESFAILIEVDAPAGCEELGRVTRAYVSGHYRTRVHESRLYAREKRCLVANFNGALPAGRSIASAVWDMSVIAAVGMATPSIVGREVRVLIEAVRCGCAYLRCEVTLDNGEVYNQLFAVTVLDGPSFGDQGAVAGPARLTVSA